MTRVLAQDDGIAGKGPVEDFLRGIGAGRVVPGEPGDRLSGLDVGVFLFEDRDDLLRVFSEQVGPIEKDPHAEGVQVVVVESREERETAGVDDAGAGSRLRQDLTVAAHRRDALAVRGQGAGGRPRRVEGDDVRIVHDEIGRAGFHDINLPTT